MKKALQAFYSILGQTLTGGYAEFMENVVKTNVFKCPEGALEKIPYKTNRKPTFPSAPKGHLKMLVTSAIARGGSLQFKKMKHIPLNLAGPTLSSAPKGHLEITL